MITQMFSVHDAVAGAYVDPFGCPTIAFALREFGAACGKPESPMGKFPTDYSLWHVGAFDGETGIVSPVTPVIIGRATDYMTQANVQVTEEDNGIAIEALRDSIQRGELER